MIFRGIVFSNQALFILFVLYELKKKTPEKPSLKNLESRAQKFFFSNSKEPTYNVFIYAIISRLRKIRSYT
jgi:hypothetical protein